MTVIQWYPGHMTKARKEIADAIPSQDVLSRSHVFRGLTAAEETKYNRKFQAIVTG